MTQVSVLTMEPGLGAGATGDRALPFPLDLRQQELVSPGFWLLG